MLPTGKASRSTCDFLSATKFIRTPTFTIDQSGFLGDQFIAIAATRNEKPAISTTRTTQTLNPLSISRSSPVRPPGSFSASTRRLRNLDDALANVTRLALTPQTLTNLALAVINLRGFSDRALMVADNVNGLLDTNSPVIAHSASNLLVFSQQLNQFADDLNGVLATNRESIHAAVDNIESSTDTLKELCSLTCKPAKAWPETCSE